MNGAQLLNGLAAEARASGAGVAFDSRRVSPGDIFVAVPGNRGDGALFAADALARGARAVVLERGGRDGARLPPGAARVILVENARLALAFLADAVFGSPSRRLKLYAVTGTNGKTTVAGMVRDIMRASGIECGLLSTVEYSWPGHAEEASRTTPDPVTLQRDLAAMADAGCAAASMEASSHALDQERMAFAVPAAAGFTNLTQDHFDYHGGFDDYFRCKRKLFAQLGAMNPGAPAAVNADDPFGLRLIADCAALGVSAVPYSAAPDSSAPVRAVGIRQDITGTRFTLEAFGERKEIATPLIGEYNVSNILCAAGMTLATGVGIDSVAAAMAALKPRWGRLEAIDLPGGARAFVDYAHSPDAIARALAALRKVTTGRLGIVFGCGGDRDRAKRPLMAQAAERAADFIVLTSDNPRSEDPEAIIDEIASGFGGAKPWTRISDRREAISFAIRGCHAGDSLLIAGKGHETYQEVAGVRHHFDDRETVRELARNILARSLATARGGA